MALATYASLLLGSTCRGRRWRAYACHDEVLSSCYQIHVLGADQRTAAVMDFPICWTIVLSRLKCDEKALVRHCLPNYASRSG